MAKIIRYDKSSRTVTKSGFILDDLCLAYFTRIWTIYIVDVPLKFGTNKYSCRDQNLLEIPHPSHLLYIYYIKEEQVPFFSDFWGLTGSKPPGVVSHGLFTTACFFLCSVWCSVAFWGEFCFSHSQALCFLVVWS
jgi:hypothetical protein